MSKTSYSKKTKCQGCKASRKDKKDGDTVWICGLFVPIEFDMVGTEPVHPRPLAKCHKPKNDTDYNRLKREVVRKRKEAVENEA